MRQKVSVYGLVKQNGKTLFLRRAVGRDDIVGKFELPGGELSTTDTPLVAIKRYVTYQLDIVPTVVQLYDIQSYRSQYDSQTQRVDILYLIGMPNDAKIQLSPRHNKFIWNLMTELQQETVTEPLRYLLTTETHTPSNVETDKNNHKHDDIKSTKYSAIIHTDGGSRGNPGPSAAGFIIQDSQQNTIEEGGAYLGVTTNSQAEYQAVRLALEAALRHQLKNVQFYIDSLMVVNQMNNIYQIKNRDLWPVHAHIKELAQQFENVTFTHIKREFNQAADTIVNKILNEHSH